MTENAQPWVLEKKIVRETRAATELEKKGALRMTETAQPRVLEEKIV